MAVVNNLAEQLRWIKESRACVPVKSDAHIAALAPKPGGVNPSNSPHQLGNRLNSITIDSDDDDIIDLHSIKPGTNTASGILSAKGPSPLSKQDVILLSSDDDDLDFGAIGTRSSSVKSSAADSSVVELPPPVEEESALPDLNQPPPSWATRSSAPAAEMYSSLQWSDDECQVNGTPLNSELQGSRVQNHFIEDAGVKLNKLQAEKIGLLERKLDVFSKRLRALGVTLDTSVLDKKIVNIDREMANLDVDDDAIQSSQDSVICDRISLLADEKEQEPSPYFNKRPSEKNHAVVDLTTENIPSVHSTVEPIIPQAAATQKLAPTQKAPATPWHDELMRLLRTKFGIAGFRPNQLDAINATISGRDVVCLMPTGGGKSLCYQLPALITTGPRMGTTVVISPLISLMQDQIYHLEVKNIAARMLNSKLSAAERNEVMNEIESGELSLLYLSPEMLNKSGRMRSALERMHSQNRMARIVIDEAHCVSSWGHDFRTDYKDLMSIKTQFPGTPIIALTATANQRVLSDIFQCVGPNRLLLTQSFNRPNLFYSVLPKVKDKFEHEIAHLCLKRFPGKTGIIYCSSKRHCEELAQKLSNTGISTNYYHAGMTSEEREEVQTKWQRGQIKVICATIAFGMGIDKGDVRFVIHATLPRNMEGYYQETGRAGRDGKESHCFLFYNFGDGQLLMQLIERDRELDYNQRNHNKDLLRRVITYCENKLDCRRVQVLQYFNEDFDPRLCKKTCDNCINRARMGMSVRDVTEEAKTIVRMVRSISSNDNVTMLQCIGFLRGTGRPKSSSLAEIGSLSSWQRAQLERIMHHLYALNVLQDRIVTNKMGFSNSYITLGRAAQDVANGKTSVKLDVMSTENQNFEPIVAPAPAKRQRARRALTDTRPTKRLAGSRKHQASRRLY